MPKPMPKPKRKRALSPRQVTALADGRQKRLDQLAAARGADAAATLCGDTFHTGAGPRGTGPGTIMLVCALPSGHTGDHRDRRHGTWRDPPAVRAPDPRRVRAPERFLLATDARPSRAYVGERQVATAYQVGRGVVNVTNMADADVVEAARRVNTAHGGCAMLVTMVRYYHSDVCDDHAPPSSRRLPAGRAADIIAGAGLAGDPHELRTGDNSDT